ncbi:MAG: hypothetical protein V2I32_10125 [Desulforhopalus sp.]|jgi:hypothetical protein|nr:hypothetical protein [Desulforhopalus sp.]
MIFSLTVLGGQLLLGRADMTATAGAAIAGLRLVTRNPLTLFTPARQSSFRPPAKSITDPAPFRPLLQQFRLNHERKRFFHAPPGNPVYAECFPAGAVEDSSGRGGNR